jgi:hypothetical protein
MTHQRKKLTDILNGGGNDFHNRWNNTTAAGDFGPLPPGEYRCHVLASELTKSKQETPGYKITFQVAEGDYRGRRLWHDLWLSDAALPLAKRDLLKLGIVRPQQLEEPLPMGLLARVRVNLRTDDDGNQYNRVKHFEVVGTEPPDPFAPAADPPDSLPPTEPQKDTPQVTPKRRRGRPRKNQRIDPRAGDQQQ